MSQGVTIWLDEPDESSTNTGVPGAEPLGNDTTRPLVSDKRDQISVSWEQPQSEAVDGVCM